MLESINKKSSSSVFSKLKDTKTQKYENEKCRFGSKSRSGTLFEAFGSENKSGPHLKVLRALHFFNQKSEQKTEMFFCSKRERAARAKHRSRYKKF